MFYCVYNNGNPLGIYEADDVGVSDSGSLGFHNNDINHPLAFFKADQWTSFEEVEPLDEDDADAPFLFTPTEMDALHHAVTTISRMTTPGFHMIDPNLNALQSQVATAALARYEAAALAADEENEDDECDHCGCDEECCYCGV